MRNLLLVLVLTPIALFGGQGKTDWSLNATAIEACSCPMFCQCYFNTQPAAHHAHGGDSKHFCKFNMAYKVNKGHHGATKLDGVKFWVTGDLGADYSQGKTDWAVVTFDKSTTSEQRQALAAILPNLFPVKWGSFETAEGNIDTWQASKDGARATLDGGKSAEINLSGFAGNNPNKQVVMHNLKYWGAPRNDGFVMMPNKLQAYRLGDKAFEYKNTNGFMITVDINSNDLKKAASGM